MHADHTKSDKSPICSLEAARHAHWAAVWRRRHFDALPPPFLPGPLGSFGSQAEESALQSAAGRQPAAASLQRAPVSNGKANMRPARVPDEIFSDLIWLNIGFVCAADCRVGLEWLLGGRVECSLVCGCVCVDFMRCEHIAESTRRAAGRRPDCSPPAAHPAGSTDHIRRPLMKIERLRRERPVDRAGGPDSLPVHMPHKRGPHSTLLVPPFAEHSCRGGAAKWCMRPAGQPALLAGHGGVRQRRPLGARQRRVQGRAKANDKADQRQGPSPHSRIYALARAHGLGGNGTNQLH
jgi:hypothetical protein